jgi:tetratricopeptide (TPR) repeat protein
MINNIDWFHMINNIDQDQKELEALSLIDQAETAADKGDGEQAINLYEQAAQIYLDFGSYIKLDELYIRLVEIISQFKNHIQATYRLKSIIRKTEELKLNEISAKLLVQLGNISNKMQDWETAGESWQKASEYFNEVDPEEYHNLSSILLLKAGQSFERSHLTKDLGKRLILKGVMKINKFDEIYEEEEKRAHHLLVNKEFKAAANKFYDIADYFKKALNNLGEIMDDDVSNETLLNSRARFIHFIAEYQSLSMICLEVSRDPKYAEKIKELGYDSIDLFKQSINLLKEYLFPEKVYFDKEVILRVTFDTMLLSMLQRMLADEQFNSIEYLLSGKPDLRENKKLVKKLEESPYFQITKKIEQVGLTDTLNDLLNVHLGHFEKIKNTLISSFL